MLQRTNRASQAEPLYRRALETWQDCLGWDWIEQSSVPPGPNRALLRGRTAISARSCYL
ncbi:MAG: hypothetical protein ACYTEX_24105 [Planctomycetota bacterium]